MKCRGVVQGFDHVPYLQPLEMMGNVDGWIRERMRETPRNIKLKILPGWQKTESFGAAHKNERTFRTSH